MTLKLRTDRKNGKPDIANGTYYWRADNRLRECAFVFLRDHQAADYTLIPGPKAKIRCHRLQKIDIVAVAGNAIQAKLNFEEKDPQYVTLTPRTSGAKLVSDGNAKAEPQLQQRENKSETPKNTKTESSVKEKSVSTESVVSEFSAVNVKAGFEHLRGYCQNLDPEDAESVYRCMQHYKYNDHPQSTSLFAVLLPESSCRSTRRELSKALKAAGFSKEFIKPRLPTCAQLAPVAKRIRWSTAWTQCLEYRPDDDRYDADCFGQFIYGQYNAKTALSNFEKTHCSTLILQYEKAIKGGVENHQLPENFVSLSCSDIERLKPAVRQRLSERAACSNVTGYVPEQGVYNCLAAAQINMEGMDCADLKVAYREVLTSLHGPLDSLLFPADCERLVNIALINSDSYKEAQRLAKRRADEAEAARRSAARKKSEREDKELAEQVSNLPRTLASLASVVARDRRSGAERIGSYSTHSFYWRRKARTELLNDVAAELKAVISSQTDRGQLQEIVHRYRFNSDWSLKNTDASILTTFEQTRDGLGPFKGLPMSLYLNAIYWTDVDYLKEYDAKVYRDMHAFTQATADSLYRSMHLLNKQFPVVDPRRLAFEEQFQRTPSLLKVAINTYLTEYQRISAACINADYIKHEFYRAATPDIVIRDGFGTEISREYGTSEVQRTYIIHKKFRAVARRLDIDESTDGDEAAAMAILKMFGSRVATVARQAKERNREVEKGVVEIMKNYSCDSDLVIEFEDSLLRAFDAYYLR